MIEKLKIQMDIMQIVYYGNVDFSYYGSFSVLFYVLFIIVKY